MIPFSKVRVKARSSVGKKTKLNENTSPSESIKFHRADSVFRVLEIKHPQARGDQAQRRRAGRRDARRCVFCFPALVPLCLEPVTRSKPALA